ncbi:hypothetical protein RCH10_001742 [Variovorax sp. GrIS 2.14]|uniref:hypothetical protein n=1 Tax=Variovorax sp. GrIS 2.14 TaxID=3071709 RepID=UPI0038F5D3D0
MLSFSNPLATRRPSCVFRTSALLVSLLLAGIAHAADLSVGFMPGPYRDAFTKGIEPVLKKKGYTIKYVEFSQGARLRHRAGRPDHHRTSGLLFTQDQVDRCIA